MTSDTNTFASSNRYISGKRWTASARQAVIAEMAKEGLRGAAAAAQAEIRHSISPEEYGAWERQLEAHGVHGLRAHRLRHVAKIARIEAKIAELSGAA